MNIKEAIESLLSSHISNYKISKDVGIAQTTLGDYTTGKSKLGNMKLDHAMKLYDYYLKNEEDIKMREIFNEIDERFYAGGETPPNEKSSKYAMYYESIEDIEEVEAFEDMYDVKIEDVNFPAIGFDAVGKDDGKLYDTDYAEDLKEAILSEAKDYFKSR